MATTESRGWHNAPTMTEATHLLSWLQWIQMLAQKIALVGSAVFAGLMLQRYWSMAGTPAKSFHATAIAGATNERSATAIVVISALCALLAGLLAGSGTKVTWLVAAVAEGLCAGYCMTELRRTRIALAGSDPSAESLAGPWRIRWRNQHRWLAFHAAWVPWLLVMSL